MKVINSFMNLMKSVPFSLRERVVIVSCIIIVVSPWFLMLLIVNRVPFRFRVRAPVLVITVFVGVPQLTTSMTRVFFTFRALHVVTSLVFQHNVATCTILTLTPES